MQEEQLAERVGERRPRLRRTVVYSCIGVITWQVLRGLQQPTQDQVVSMTPPLAQDLNLAPGPIGGPSESPTGAGAGGSAAAGYEAGRVGASLRSSPSSRPSPTA